MIDRHIQKYRKSAKNPSLENSSSDGFLLMTVFRRHGTAHPCACSSLRVFALCAELRPARAKFSGHPWPARGDVMPASLRASARPRPPACPRFPLPPLGRRRATYAAAPCGSRRASRSSSGSEFGHGYGFFRAEPFHPRR